MGIVLLVSVVLLEGGGGRTGEDVRVRREVDWLMAEMSCWVWGLDGWMGLDE